MTNPRATIFPKKLTALVGFLCAMMIAGEIYAVSQPGRRNPAVIPGLAFMPMIAWIALNHMASLFADLQAQIDRQGETKKAEKGRKKTKRTGIIRDTDAVRRATAAGIDLATEKRGNQKDRHNP